MFFEKVDQLSLKEIIACGELGFADTAAASKSAQEDLLETCLVGVAPLERAGPRELTFFHNPKYKNQLAGIKAAACILEEDYVPFLPEGVIALISETPLRSYAKVMKAFYPLGEPSLHDNSIHPTAIIDPSAQVGARVSIGPYVVVGKNVKIGDDVSLGAHAILKPGVVVGDGSKIEEQVVISHALLGKAVRCDHGVKIGQTGFGFHMDKRGAVSVPHVGAVIIEDGVEIGANTTVDRGSMNNTVIGAGTRIDNLVQIGHNVEIGKGCIIVAQAGIAGSTKIGDYTVLGGQVGISGHLKIGRGVQIAAQSGIVKSIPDGQAVGGSPAVPIKDWHRQNVALAKMTRHHLKKK
ncbi:UDP-3-O-(3-hydroxymyristoyl)glucosamine N-acyltransferase [Alphaproteobacteria bacterium]|nr:UDP-3-O-(3-hydroxymyristoyl)glucosamine N-acyltransferase [Alphaproteobacteria bacterium]